MVFFKADASKQTITNTQKTEWALGRKLLYISNTLVSLYFRFYVYTMRLYPNPWANIYFFIHFFVAWTDRKPFKDVRGIMLHPQIGSEGTEFRSDFFHSSLRYIFDSLWKSKDKEIVCHMLHIHIARIFLKGLLRLPFLLHELIENLSKM